MALTLHWLRARYTAFILRICTCQGGSSCCTRASTWLRKRSVSPRTCGRRGVGVRRGRGAAGGASSLAPSAHLLQLVALLLHLLQGPEAALLVLRVRKDVAVEAGREEG